MRFERSGRGQEPSRGHKFSILENVVLHRDFTSAMRLHFRSDLVGVALVGATPLHLLSQTALPLKSPTGAFIAPLRCANASLPMAGGKVHHAPSNEKQSVPDGERHVVHIAIVCGFLQGASARRTLSFILTFLLLFNIFKIFNVDSIPPVLQLVLHDIHLHHSL